MKDYSRSFTLIELLVSVSIIAILIAIGIASYATVNKQSRDTKRKADIEQIRSALEMYRSDYGSYPPINTSGFDAASNLVGALTVSGDYLPSIPTDPMPSVHSYYYESADHDTASDKYYGYCLCGYMEINQTTDSNCEHTLPNVACTYGRRSP